MNEKQNEKVSSTEDLSLVIQCLRRQEHEIDRLKSENERMLIRQNELQYAFWTSSAGKALRRKIKKHDASIWQSIKNVGISATLKGRISENLRKKTVKSIKQNGEYYPWGNIWSIFRGVMPPAIGRRMDNALDQAETNAICPLSGSEANWDYSCKDSIQKPLVSIIVPSYNHAKYLRERLSSIYNQTYRNFEVILLDDCSSDNSRDILNEFATKYADNTRTIYNNKNSGSVFSQWERGILAAQGDLIWIAESDDYCSINFLSSLVPAFEDRAVTLSFARTEFVNNGKSVWNTEQYLSDTPALNWTKPFLTSAHVLVNNGFAVKNVIPNVSSAVFKNNCGLPKAVKDQMLKLKLCGDWLFYLETIQGGIVYYCTAATNYYRIHDDSTSLKVQKTLQYFDEIEVIAEYVATHYLVPRCVFKTVRENLKAHFKQNGLSGDISQINNHFSVNKLCQLAKRRVPSVAMLVYSFSVGGGETLPIFMANELKRIGIPVTLINMNLGDDDKAVHGLIDASVPIVNIEHSDSLPDVLRVICPDIVHSHHASVDSMVADAIISDPSLICRQVISMHGMYEELADNNVLDLMSKYKKTAAQIVYTADKNLSIFMRLGIPTDKFIKCRNGLPTIDVTPKNRNDLGIPNCAFVLCLTSRAIPEKGWSEAIQAVDIANRHNRENGGKPIHLIIIGDGVYREELQGIYDFDFVHFVGMQERVRDYYAISDMGFIPSRFRGESAPLVLIDALMCGKPVLSSDVGEVRDMLKCENGELAGIVFKFTDWRIDVNEMADIIINISNDPILLERLTKNACQNSNKFSIEKMVQDYLKIYHNVLEGLR